MKQEENDLGGWRRKKKLPADIDFEIALEITSQNEKSVSYSAGLPRPMPQETKPKGQGWSHGVWNKPRNRALKSLHYIVSDLCKAAWPAQLVKKIKTFVQ